jgi:hypothetical protein
MPGRCAWRVIALSPPPRDLSQCNPARAITENLNSRPQLLLRHGHRLSPSRCVSQAARQTECDESIFPRDLSPEDRSG